MANNRKIHGKKYKKSMGKHKNLWQKNKKIYGKVFPLIYRKMTLFSKKLYPDGGVMS